MAGKDGSSENVRRKVVAPPSIENPSPPVHAGRKKPKRLAVIDRELCSPQACGFYLCRKSCPINRSGQDCITVSELDKKPLISEELCIGCGICVKKCPKSAIDVVNLPAELNEMPIHRYGQNLFSLYRIPVPKKNSVIGLIGPNGVGKSTVLNILSGNIKPNTGLLGKKETSWEQIIERFRGTELQDYLESLSRKKIRSAYKPQKVDLIPKMWKGKVFEMLKKVEGGKAKEGAKAPSIEGSAFRPESEIVKNLKMEGMLGKEIKDLSGGELQLLAIAATMLKEADFYFFDEPSSYLDAYERLLVAKEIRRLSERAVVMVVEHDLAVADYLADYTHILYGKPGVFGVVSKPYGVRVGINTYLEGYIQEENVRFRPEPIIFSRVAKTSEKTKPLLEFSGFEKSFREFSLSTEPGTLHKGEVIGVLGPNSTGKTTFIRMLTGELKPDKGEPIEGMKLSYKPQRLVLDGDTQNMIVEEFIRKKRGKLETEDRTLLRNLGVEKLFLRTMHSLSGGELQSVFISTCLLQEAEILLFDEPSAFLDVEQRLRVAKLIRQISEGKEISCFVVDHDLQFMDAVSDKVMVFEGIPGKNGHGLKPCPLEDGMNRLLKSLGVTYRRDPHTGRPRANKPGSQKDIEQKESGRYYYS
ncbi:MAG: ribosome biogenesis/translation initiation ATPase RLI [Candidatus Aenigmarchaeota archaeon]|nr:ribosome biogenesis/translation initiation ATPase RLI [Candidatus Aenigmarchaeota archaeon]